MHTSAMKTKPNGIAPSHSRYRMGAKNGVVAQAWQYVWDRLSTEEFRDAVELADEAARIFHIVPESVRAHMYACAREAEGILESEVRPVPTQVTRKFTPKDGPAYSSTFTGTRKHTFYRIRKDPA